MSSGSEHDGKNDQRDYHNDISWSQHSDRTHVTDNKTVKSQNQTIPDNIYENGSTRTLDSLVSLTFASDDSISRSSRKTRVRTNWGLPAAIHGRSASTHSSIVRPSMRTT